MKKIIILSVFLLNFLLASAQSLNWTSTMTGIVNPSNGWSGTIDPSIAIDASNNSYITGYFEGTVDFDPGPGITSKTSNGGKDIYIQKLDPNGNLLWIKTLGGTNDDIGNEIDLDGSGNIYISGSYRLTVDFNPGGGVFNITTNSRKTYVLKLTNFGDFLWAKSHQGTGYSEILGMKVNSAGDIFLTGIYGGNVDFDPNIGVNSYTTISSDDMFIQKLNSIGNHNWVKVIGSNLVGIHVNGNAIDVDASSNVYVTGIYQGPMDFDPSGSVFNLPAGVSSYSNNGFVLKLNSLGGFIWAKAINCNNGGGADIKVDNNGNVYSVGKFTGTTDFDPGIGLYNLTTPIYSNAYQDIYVLKLNANGDFLWAKRMGTSGNDLAFSLELDCSNNIYTSGQSSLNVDMDPGPAVHNFIGGSFLQKLDQNGNFISVYGNTLFDFKLNTSGNIFKVLLNDVKMYTEPVTCTDSYYTLNQSICYLDSFLFKGEYLDVSGLYYDTLNNILGSDSFLTLNLNVLNPIISSTTHFLCNGDSFLFGNTYINSPGVFNDTLSSFNNCDSLTYINVVVANNTVGTYLVNSCTPSYTWIDGNTYTANNNTATHTLTNANGCDSVVTLNLTINNSTTSTEVISACNAYTWIDGITYTSSNNTATYNVIGGSPNGCDQLRTLNLTISNSVSGIDTQSACGSFTWINGNTYTANNTTATHTIVNGAASGCDSVITLNLSIINNTFGTDVVTACNNYTWIDGNTYTSNNNTATHTLTGASTAGCDSIVTLNLSINNSSSTDIISACESYTWIDGNTYTASNNSATHTLTNSLSCDSVIHLDLTIHQTSNTVYSTTLCQNDSLFFANSYLNTAGTYYDTLQNVFSCDSFVTLNLFIDSVESIWIDTTICQNESLIINGISYPSQGVFFDTAFYNLSSCDSIFYTIDLKIDSVLEINIDTTICAGDFILVNGSSYSNSGVFGDTVFHTQSGCDSIRYAITLNIDNVSLVNIDTSICQGETLVLNGENYTSSGIYDDTAYYSVSACDSIIYSINLSVDSFETITIDTTICEGDLFVINGISYSNSGNYLDTAHYFNSGCDSILYDITIQVDTVNFITVNASICEDDSIILNGQTYNITGVYTDSILYNQSGCDSIKYTINLIVNPNYNDTIYVSICANDSYLLPDASLVSTASIYHFVDTSIYGCDSLFSINLSIDTLPITNRTISICEGDSMFLQGFWQNTSGIYIDTLIGQNCDSILNTNLIVNPLPLVTANASNNVLCQGDSLTLAASGADSYIWSISVNNNASFVPPIGTSSYSVIGTDLNFCSSTDSIMISVYPSYINTLNIEVCEDELPYTFPDGSIHNTLLDIVQTSNLTSSQNCDSVIITDLVVNQLGIYGETPDSIALCDDFYTEISIESQYIESYQWSLNNTNLNDAGIYLGSATNSLLISPLEVGLNGNTYQITMYDECGNGPFQDETYMRVTEPHSVSNPIADIEKCMRDSSVIFIDYNGLNYVWEDGQLGQYIQADESGLYSVSFIESGTNCIMHDDFNVIIEDCISNCIVSVPSAFSPRSTKGKNDIFRALTNCEEGFSYYKFTIYNRWGELIFETNDFKKGWDGTYKNQKVAIGEYIYNIDYSKNKLNRIESIKGTVVLIK